MKDDAAANIKTRDSFKYVLVVEGVVIGLITGALISVFRLMLIYADSIRGRMVTFAGSSIGAALICAGILIVTAVCVSLLLGWEPDIAGSGIPQAEAELRGQKDMCWWRVIIAKIAGCTLAIVGGLALGREGPSIQLGAMVGKGFSRLRHRLLTEERLLITCGAGAGLSAAFGAPLAGAMFALEELHRNFSAEVLLSTMAASAASEFIAANVFGLTPVFGFEIEHSLPLRYYWAVIILGLILGLLGMVYNRTIACMQDFFDAAGLAFAHTVNRIHGLRLFNLTDSKLSSRGASVSRTGRMIIMFSCAFVLIFCYPEALGSGSSLVGEISTGSFTLTALVILLAVKFAFSTASFGSGSPGGIFLPLLVLGAVSGGLFCRLMGLAGFDQKYITAMVVISMAGFFSAVVRAPVTGVILITEMTGDFTCLLPLVLTSLLAYLTAELLGVEPIYTQLLHRSQSKAYVSAGAEGGGTILRKRKSYLKSTSRIRNSISNGGQSGSSGIQLGNSGSHESKSGSSQFGNSGSNLCSRRFEGISLFRGSHESRTGKISQLRDRKTIIDADVHTGSYMDGRRVMDFGLPLGTLIVSVTRDEREMIPDGHTILRAGDSLEILTREGDIRDAEDIIEEKCMAVSH